MRISDWSSDVCSSDLIEEMAEYASVPVINGLTDASHPCQIMADLLTIIESGKQLPGLKVAWLGDGNNVLASIMEAAGLMQFDVVAACPQGYQPSEADLALGQGRARCVGNARRSEEHTSELPSQMRNSSAVF